MGSEDESSSVTLPEDTPTPKSPEEIFVDSENEKMTEQVDIAATTPTTKTVNELKATVEKPVEEVVEEKVAEKRPAEEPAEAEEPEAKKSQGRGRRETC